MYCLPPQTKSITTIYAQLSVYAPLCGNITSSTKPEANNLLHCHQRKIEPQPRVMHKKFGESGQVVLAMAYATRKDKHIY